MSAHPWCHLQQEQGLNILRHVAQPCGAAQEQLGIEIATLTLYITLQCTAQTGGCKGLTSNTGPGDAVGAAGAVLGALGSVVGVGNDLVRVRLEADEAVGILEGVGGCTERSQMSIECKCTLNIHSFCAGSSVSCR